MAAYFAWGNICRPVDGFCADRHMFGQAKEQAISMITSLTFGVSGWKKKRKFFASFLYAKIKTTNSLIV